MQKAKKYDWKDSNVALIGTSEDRTLKKESAMQEPVWQPILKAKGPELFVFRINQFKVEAVPKTEHGQFYNGDSYIIVNVYLQEEKLMYDAHFWIGSNSTQDEYGTAAYKTVEVDNLLDDRAVQHREVEGHESDLFKSYFRKLQILDGGYKSGFRQVKPEEYKPRLMHFCQKGNRVEIKEVSYTVKSLTSDDVFILDTGSKAIQWNGKTCNPREKMAAAHFLQSLESERMGRLKSEVVDENDSENKHFLSLLPDDPVSERPFKGGEFRKAIYRLSDENGRMEFTCVCEGSAPESSIAEDDVYFVMGTKEVFVYIGSKCSIDERKNALIYGSNFLNSTENPCAPLTVVDNTTAKLKGMNKILD